MLNFIFFRFMNKSRKKRKYQEVSSNKEQHILKMLCKYIRPTLHLKVNYVTKSLSLLPNNEK